MRTRGSRSVQNARNSLDQNGNPLLCHNCGSWNHLSAACPDNQQANVLETEETTEVDLVEELGIMLMTEVIPSCDVLKADMNFEILDSACSSTVCGKKWLVNYLQTLTEEERKSIGVCRAAHIQIWKWLHASVP